MLQDEDFSHKDLMRRARRKHERKLAEVVDDVVAMTNDPATQAGDYVGVAGKLFDACIAAIPYAPAAAFLGKEKGKLVNREGEPLRVALVADAVGGMHGVTHTLDEIQERGVPGFEVEVVGTDANVDRRLSAVAEIDIPFYAGLQVGVPSLPGIVETLAEGRYDLVHLCSPGPAGVAAAIARARGRGSCRTPSSGRTRRCGGARRSTRPRGSSATHTPRRSTRRCWRSPGSGSARRPTGSRRSPSTSTGSSASATPTATAF